MGMLKGFAGKKKEPETSERIDTESTFTEMDLDTAIQHAAQGFEHNEKRLQEMRDKMSDPGSPQFNQAAVRLPNSSASSILS